VYEARDMTSKEQGTQRFRRVAIKIVKPNENDDDDIENRVFERLYEE
jgi:hypothetical protein